MKSLHLLVATLVITGMVSASASSEARVRDPISRKNSPQKGFFESRPSSSQYSRSQYARSVPQTTSQVVVSSPTTVGPTVVTAPSTVITSTPAYSTQPTPVQYGQPARPTSRFIRAR